MKSLILSLAGCLLAIPALANTNVFNPPDGFWLAPHVYNHTLYGPSTPNGTNSHWYVAQWNTYAGDLPAFGTYGPTATWNDPFDVTWNDNGWNSLSVRGWNVTQQPCGNELDGFLSPVNSDYPNYPQAAPGPSPALSSLSDLTHTISFRVNNWYDHDNTCAATQAFAQSSFILSNPSHGQTFYFQIMLFEERMSTAPLWWATGSGGTYGYTVPITTWGGGMPTQLVHEYDYSVNMLPQIESAIAYAASHYGMDGNLADWKVGGSFNGQAVWGHVELDVQYKNWTLTY